MFRIKTLCLLAMFSCASTVAVAQTTTQVPPKTAELTTRPAPQPTTPETASRTKRVKKGPVTLGINFIFNFTSGTNEIEDASGTVIDVSDSTSFLRLEPQFEYYIQDGVPITFSAGWLRRSLNRGDDDNSSSDELLLLAGSGYHIEINEAFTLFATAGLGGYFGNSDRTTINAGAGTTGPATVNETTSTGGFAGNVALGAGLGFSEQGQLRAGINYTGLIGSESIESTGKSFSVVTHNLALNVGMFYNF